MICPQCNSNDWDYANVGVPKAILCTNCGYIYGKGTKNMKNLTVLYGSIIFDEDGDAIIKRIEGLEHIEAGSIDDCLEIAEHNSRFYGGDYIIPSVFEGDIKFDIEDKGVVRNRHYSLGDNPLDKFPSIWSK